MLNVASIFDISRILVTLFSKQNNIISEISNILGRAGDWFMASKFGSYSRLNSGNKWRIGASEKRTRIIC